MSKFQYLTVECDADKRLWLKLLTQDTTPENTVTLLEELSDALESATNDASLQGIVIRVSTTEITGNTPSSKPQSPQQIANTLQLVQDASQQLLTLGIPSIVILDSSASLYLMSLAMAANYCISSNASHLKLAFNEAHYGLHPNMVTTQQAIQRLGTTVALDYLLTGDSLTPHQAAAKGLIDACVPPDKLHTTALDFLTQKPNRQQAGFTQRLRTLAPLRKAATFDLDEKPVQIGNPQHYPAPYALLRLWKQYGLSNAIAVQAAYTRSIEQLSLGEPAQNLSRITGLKTQRLHAGSQLSANTIKHIYLIGFGTTVANIATFLLSFDIKVTLHDKQNDMAGQTLTEIKQHLAAKFADDANTLHVLTNNLFHDQDGSSIREADLVLVLKDLNLPDSQEIFAELEEKTRPDTILATHSTTLSLDKIGAALLDSQRLIGLHFCDTAPQIELAEVAFSHHTAPEVLAKTLQLLRQLGKIPLPMQSSPGLLVDRILVHYILQGIRLHQQGVPHAYVDHAGRASGMPHGPLELADKLGLDYCLRITEALQKAQNNVEIPYQLNDMVNAGKLGIKSGSGFYRYRNGNRLKIERRPWNGSEQALQEKLAGQICEEAAICLEEGLLEDPDSIDIGITLGTGFAPYRGGPLYQRHNRAAHNQRVEQ